MLLLRNTCPVDYRLCVQTVTVYRRKEDQYIRTVHTNAFFDRKKNWSVDKIGSKEVNSFLLVIPGSAQCVFTEDKVLEGVGPEITTADQWRDFVPAKVPELVTVKYADPKRWNGQIVHTEAGG